MTIAELLAKLDTGKAVTILDVRNDDEFEHWKIEARQPFPAVHIPYFDFIEDEEAAIRRVPTIQGTLIVVCAKGGSSEMVAETLRGAGVAAENLEGGMVEYGEFLQAVEVPLRPADQGHLEIWQFNRRGKGCLSYVIVSGTEAIVVDPSRSVDVYERFLAQRKLRTRCVLDSHVHADHVSGGRILAARVGSDYSTVEDGQILQVGQTPVRVIATPGHTPGSVCFLVAEQYLLSGDTVFTRALGRPDLGGHVVQWSRDLFHTLAEKIAALPDSTLVLPAHYADVSEIGPEGVVSAELGALRENLPEFGLRDCEIFTRMMQDAVRTPPAEYAEIIDINAGRSTAGADHIVQLELGKNECAASAHK
jgi:glyoxylase-like metal-dependent hydrolase (beta-lactamase superfamily II)/rhodanese-related sulfurtransferase